MSQAGLTAVSFALALLLRTRTGTAARQYHQAFALLGLTAQLLKFNYVALVCTVVWVILPTEHRSTSVNLVRTYTFPLSSVSCTFGATVNDRGRNEALLPSAKSEVHPYACPLAGFQCKKSKLTKETYNRKDELI